MHCGSHININRWRQREYRFNPWSVCETHFSLFGNTWLLTIDMGCSDHHRHDTSQSQQSSLSQYCDSHNTRDHTNHTIHYDNLGRQGSPTHDSRFSTRLTSVGWRQVCFFLHLFSKFDPQLHSSLQLIQGLASSGGATWRGHWWKSTLVEINHFVNIQNLLIFIYATNRSVRTQPLHLVLFKWTSTVIIMEWLRIMHSF